MKEYFLKILAKKYFDVVLVGDTTLSVTERFTYLTKSVITFAPIALVLDIINLWFTTNQLFFSGVVGFVFLNLVLGAYMHAKQKSFNWFVLIHKTITMVVVILLTYLVLELILKVAGDNIVTDIFRKTLQVATLLYPGSKILKNIFILSEGEHPPKWIMKKIYNFQENGNLSELLDTKHSDEPSKGE